MTNYNNAEILRNEYIKRVPRKTVVNICTARKIGTVATMRTFTPVPAWNAGSRTGNMIALGAEKKRGLNNEKISYDF